MKTKQDTLGAIFTGCDEQTNNKKGAGTGAGWRARLQGQPDADADAIAAELAAARAALPGANIGDMLVRAGKHAAQIQARRLVNLRGVAPSQTSQDDAAADATAYAVRVGLRLARWVDLQKDYAPRTRGGRLVRRSAYAVLLLNANRAAFRSLCSWASVGMSGTESDKFCNGGAFVGELTAAVGEQLKDERDTGAGAGDMFQHDTVAARWRVVRWVYRVGVQRFARTLAADTRPAARAAAMAAAVDRCRVVASCMFGLPLSESIADAGFSSGAAFVNSCLKSQFFPSLAAASGGADVAQARAAMRAAALDAAAAIRQQRAAQSSATAMPGFWASGIRTQTELATLPGHGGAALSAKRQRANGQRNAARLAWAMLPASARWAAIPRGERCALAWLAAQRLAGGTVAPTLRRGLRAANNRLPVSVQPATRNQSRAANGQPVRGVIVANGGRSDWTMAAERRGAAMARAVFWRNVASKRAAANLAAFQVVLRGLRADKFSDLSKVFGLSKRSSKLHSLFIRRRPSGTVSTRRDVPTVALKVGRAARSMPCALLA